MKFLLLLLLLVSLQAQASPGSAIDFREQKEKLLLKRIVVDELKMNIGKMKAIIKSNNIEFEHKNNTISFEINGFYFTIVYDESADRMRIVVPIAKVSGLSQELLNKAMEANYHTALDARYAVSNGIMWSVFIHPLSDLSEALLQSALDQTYVAAATFGNEYSSSGLFFPKRESGDSDKEEAKIDPDIEAGTKL